MSSASASALPLVRASRFGEELAIVAGPRLAWKLLLKWDLRVVWLFSVSLCVLADVRFSGHVVRECEHGVALNRRKLDVLVAWVGATGIVVLAIRAPQWPA